MVGVVSAMVQRKQATGLYANDLDCRRALPADALIPKPVAAPILLFNVYEVDEALFRAELRAERLLVQGFCSQNDDLRRSDNGGGILAEETNKMADLIFDDFAVRLRSTR